MKLKFDSNQTYQLEAVASIVDLFEGQTLNQDDFAVEIHTPVEKGQSSFFQSELGIGNNIILSDDTIYNNLISIQDRNDLDPINQSDFVDNGKNFFHRNGNGHR